jgi:hypothetical protein
MHDRPSGSVLGFAISLAHVVDQYPSEFDLGRLIENGAPTGMLFRIKRYAFYASLLR